MNCVLENIKCDFIEIFSVDRIVCILFGVLLICSISVVFEEISVLDIRSVFVVVVCDWI